MEAKERGAGKSSVMPRPQGCPVPFGFAMRDSTSALESFKRESAKVIARFLDHRLSFPECIAALDVAHAQLIPRLTREHYAALRALMLANNETVMTEMEKRTEQRASDSRPEET
jgi:hypothetical protein